jgi:hypothetical protein
VLADDRACTRLPSQNFHGKEGVDGSSPSEGSAKLQLMRGFPFGSICRFSNVGQVWSPLWSLQLENALVKRPFLADEHVNPTPRRQRF